MADISPQRIALSLGGNLGDVAAAFDSAIDSLEEEGLCEIRRSSLYKTAPVECAPGTPYFLNMALTGVWNDSYEALFALCKELEIRAGRPAEHARNASRTLDLDIILFGELIIDLPHLKIPHIELQNRLFVLEPLAEIAPEWKDPSTGMTISMLLDKLSESK